MRLTPAAPVEWHCNMGGPMSRTRTQPVRCTVLGAGDDQYGCPLVISLGLDFGRRDPLNTVLKLLKSQRINDPETLRLRFAMPDEPCICSPWHKPALLHIASDDQIAVLQQVLLLGLCTAHYFDPARPLLLTRASLTRRIQLFAGRGFYA